jgi:hypothetical protein
MKQELKRRPIYECRCDERLKDKDEGSARLEYTGLRGGLEHIRLRLLFKRLDDFIIAEIKMERARGEMSR